jgi:hypothetical protein
MNSGIDALQKAAFLEDLEKLYRKYHIEIEACGCCNSPWLVPIDDDMIDTAIYHLETTEAE